MSNILDLTGHKYGRLRVVRFLGVQENKSMWLCKCDCGNEVACISGTIRSGNKKSCGCLKRDAFKKTIQKNIKHGMTVKGKKDPLYRLWSRIKRQAVVKGVPICDKWVDFDGFSDDVRDCYFDGATFSMIDERKGFNKENCKFITKKEKRKSIKRVKALNIDGVNLSFEEASKKYGVKVETIKSRIYKTNMTHKEAVTKPVKYNSNR